MHLPRQTHFLLIGASAACMQPHCGYNNFPTVPAHSENNHPTAETPFLSDRPIAYFDNNLTGGDDPPRLDRVRAFWGTRFSIEPSSELKQPVRPPIKRDTLP